MSESERGMTSSYTHLNDLPQEHPRAVLVRRVEASLSNVFLEMKSESELTVGEVVRIVTNFAAQELGSIAKYTIRHERHGKDSDKPGDLV